MCLQIHWLQETGISKILITDRIAWIGDCGLRYLSIYSIVDGSVIWIGHVTIIYRPIHHVK